MKLIAAIMIGLTAAVAIAFLLPPAQVVTTSIDIAAPPARVWAVLTNTAVYPAWNPGMALKGALTPGNTIEHDEGEGDNRMVFHPVVVAATPDTVLSWRGSVVLPHVLDVLHSFTLAPIATGTRLTQSVEMHGVLLWVWDSGQLVPRFQAFDAALKARAEMTR